MINMMYLVFIAMLALNIDKEVLATIGVINEDLETSIWPPSKYHILINDFPFFKIMILDCFQNIKKWKGRQNHYHAF